MFCACRRVILADKKYDYMQCYGSPIHDMVLKRHLLALDQVRSGTSSRLRVFQWNVLADGLAQHGGFSKVIHFLCTRGHHGSCGRPIYIAARECLAAATRPRCQSQLLPLLSCAREGDLNHCGCLGKPTGFRMGVPSPAFVG